MEIWFRNNFLSLLMLSGGIFSAPASSADVQDNEGSALIEPDIERIVFDEAQIDSSDFELMLAVGYLSIEDFGVSTLLAAKLNYYVNESIFVQLTLARATAGETSFEIISGGAPLLTDDERDLTYYSIDIGYNLLPGEAFFSPQTTYNTAFYLSGGIGVVEFAGSDEFAVNFGAGYRLLLSDDFSITVDFRNLAFDVDVFGENKVTNNLQFTVGAGWFF